MVYIPIHDYDGNLDYVGNRNPEIKECRWTGKTFRFTFTDESDEDKICHCYAVYPDLPKVNYTDWLALSTTMLWGSEINAQRLKSLIADKRYRFDRMLGRWFLVVDDVIELLKTKSDVEITTVKQLMDKMEEEGWKAYWGPDSKDITDYAGKGYVNNSKDQVDAVATGVVINKVASDSNQLNQKEYNQLFKGKEQEKMNGLFDEIKVGKASHEYSITYFGTVAFRGKTYYNGKIFDATGMTINFDMLYLVPASEVKEGDIVDKNGKAYYVKGVSNGVVNAIDLMAGTEENLVPGGPFGMTLYSKIFNPFGAMKGENAFGNMLMLQALSDGGNGNNGMLMAMMMMQGGFKLPTFEMPNVDLSNKETK